MNGIDRRKRSGFTLIEVMIAIGVMTVGSLGILSMHQAVSNANKSAREMNTALAITERWVERVERDSLSWSEQGLNSTSLAGTAYLQGLSGTVSTTGWFTPQPADTDESYMADYFGDDGPGRGATKYCTNLSLSWLRQGSSARVDIRTFWYREGHLFGAAKHPQWVGRATFQGAACDAATADGWGLGTAPDVNVVFASTVVTWLRRQAP